MATITAETVKPSRSRGEGSRTASERSKETGGEPRQGGGNPQETGVAAAAKAPRFARPRTASSSTTSIRAAGSAC